MIQPRKQSIFEYSLLLVVCLSLFVFWFVTLMFMGILEDDRILEKFFTRPSVYEIGMSNDPK